MKISVGIAGASGYSGGELIALICKHPNFEIKYLAASSKVGKDVASLHPHLAHLNLGSFQETDAKALSECDLVFLALPHGASSELAKQISQGTKIVDLGADFRLEDANAWSMYYKDAPAHAGTWVYGLSELVGEQLIATSDRVANPGCYATAIALGALPMLPFVDAQELVVVAASGTSGAGRSANENLLATELIGSVSSYKTGGIHQHTPEIEQTLKNASGLDVTLSFTPLLAPMVRGIHATITGKINGNLNILDLRKAYEKQYATSPFVNLLDGEQQPKTSSVLGSNYVQMQTTIDTHSNRVVTTVVIDNLVKGAAGQALQNANLMFGLPSSTGLSKIGLAP
jgi:N-acetyl-gamma-glutamyl-phosphate reductase